MDFFKRFLDNLAIEVAFLSEGALIKLTVETLHWSLVFVLLDFSALHTPALQLSGMVEIIDLEVCYYSVAKAFAAWFSVFEVLLFQVDLSWDPNSEYVIKSEDVLENDN